MVADNNKNDEVRQLYKENGRDQIYPVVIKDSLSDGNGKYGDDAFGTWFRTTDMETKSLSVCEDADFYNESTSKPNFKYIQVKDSSMLINMPLTVGGVKDSDGKWSVDALNVKTKNVSIECNEAIAIDSSKLTVKAKGMSAKITIDSSVFEIFSAGTDAKKNIQLLIGGEKTSLTQFVSDKFTFTDTNCLGADYLTIDDSSGFTFNKQITMTQGLTVYCETDRNFTIQAKKGAAGPTINITGADDMTGMLNISKMTVNLDASTNVTVNGVGTFGSLITGYNNTTYIDSDNKWSSNRLLFTNNNYALDTTGGGSHYGIVSTGRRIVALDSNKQITPLVLNYPLSNVHSSVEMYDASIINDASVGHKLIVGSNLALYDSSNIATVKGEAGLTLTAGNSENNIKLQIGENTKLTVDNSSVWVMSKHFAACPNNTTNYSTSRLIIDASTPYVLNMSSSAASLIRDSSKGIRFDSSNIKLLYGNNNMIMNDSNTTFSTEVKAKVNGANDVYLGLPVGSVIDWYGDYLPNDGHWLWFGTNAKYCGYIMKNKLITEKEYKLDESGAYVCDTKTTSGLNVRNYSGTTMDKGDGYTYFIITKTDRDTDKRIDYECDYYFGIRTSDYPEQYKKILNAAYKVYLGGYVGQYLWRSYSDYDGRSSATDEPMSTYEKYLYNWPPNNKIIKVR